MEPGRPRRPQDPRYGKNLTVQKFGMKDRHYSFDHKSIPEK
jgi:hypothetical protein